MTTSFLRLSFLLSLSRGLWAIRHRDGSVETLRAEVQGGNLEQPTVLQYNTRTWLYMLAKSGVPANCGQFVCLKDIPDSEWQRIANDHIDVVWLLGMWQVGEQGVKDSRAVIHWWKDDVPDITQEDAIGSPYSISDYAVHSDIGSMEDLAEVRKKMRQHGLRLMVDFVPNHSAKDSTWIKTNPEIYLKRPHGDQSSNDFWQHISGMDLAHGRSPFADLWQDTLQLNYWEPKTIELMTSLLVKVAEHADAIRCDMAMLILNDVFGRSWGGQMHALGLHRPSEEFWRKAIREVKSRFPETIFVAEAYDYGITQTPEKQLLVQLGFDYIYDKDVLDKLESHHLDNTRGYIQWRGGDYFRHTVHFVENHDEPRAAKAFGDGHRGFIGAVAAATLPGMRLFNDYQFDGFKHRMPVQLRRPYGEQPDPWLHGRYTKFLSILADPVFHRGTWTYIDVPKEHSGWRLMAWRWALGNTRRLVVINFSDQTGGGAVPVWDAHGEHDHIELKELLTDNSLGHRSAHEMRSRGLYCILDPFSAQIFSY